MKRIQEEKYRRKIEQIEKKYRDTEEEKLRVPQDMLGYNHLSVFCEEKYDEIQTDRIEIPRIGVIQLSKEEEAILRRSIAGPERKLYERGYGEGLQPSKDGDER